MTPGEHNFDAATSLVYSCPQLLPEVILMFPGASPATLANIEIINNHDNIPLSAASSHVEGIKFTSAWGGEDCV